MKKTWYAPKVDQLDIRETQDILQKQVGSGNDLYLADSIEKPLEKFLKRFFGSPGSETVTVIT